MRRSVPVIILLVLLALACNYDRQPAIVSLPNASGSTIQGEVTSDGHPIPGVTVTISNRTFGLATVVSDVNGTYTFANVAPGDYLVRFQLAGFAPVTRSVKVGGLSVLKVAADLRVSGVSEAITVTAAAPVSAEGAVFSSNSIRGGNNVPLSRPQQSAPNVSSPPVSYAFPSAKVGGVAGGVVTAMPSEVRSGPEYASFADHSFVDAKKEATTTFAIDVDRASYANIRRYLRQNMTPPVDAVRIEEMVNYFTYAYPQPGNAHPFSITADVASCPWNTNHRLLRIGVQGRNLEQWKMAPNNLVFLLDVSGSMSPPERLPLIKSAFQLLVDQLRPEDSVAIVVYAGAAGLVLPPTSGADKRTIREALERLQAGGSTAGGAGIELAYKVALDNFRKGANNRVILATDGDFNVGISSLDALQTLIEEKRKSGVFLTTLGVGDDNYRDTILELLADKGNGNYAYLDSFEEAKKVFSHELTGTLVTIAKDVKIQLEFDPALVAEYRQIGYENRALANKDFEDDAKDAGDLGAGHSVTALYEIVPASAARGRVASVRLRYKQPDGDVSQPIVGEAIDRGATIWESSPDFQFAAAVAQFGMLLRNSPHKGTATYADVLAMARASRSIDPLREEFTRMVDAVHTRSGGVTLQAPAAE